MAILVQQNQGFFLASQSLVLEPISKYRTPELKTVFIVFAFFLAGLILGTYFLTVHYLRAKKIVKHLSAEAETKNKQISRTNSTHCGAHRNRRRPNRRTIRMPRRW